jgi:hypothetical protein
MTDIRTSLNVFGLTAEVGQIALLGPAGPLSQTVMVLSTSLNTVLPGYPVKLVAGTSQVPLIDLAVPGTDSIYGLAIFNPKQASFVAKDILQATTKGTCMFLKANTTMHRGDKVGLDPTSYKVIAATDANFIGTLKEDSVADQIVEVELGVPQNDAPTS